jgi:nicotinamidase/pyrazinamidase
MPSPDVDALLIVDFQNDFVPGGALPVVGGDEISEPLNRLLDKFDLVIATRDWHPPNHSSFVSAWPVHCVQGTPGAELHASLDRDGLDIVVDKGQDPVSEGYSAFQDTGLAELLRSRGVDRLYVGGLATDYCVKQSVLDALCLGFDVVVIADAIRGVEQETGDSARAIEAMKEAGAVFVQADDVERARGAGA